MLKLINYNFIVSLTMLSWKNKNTRNTTKRLFFKKKSNRKIMPNITKRTDEINMRIPSHVSHDNQYAQS